MESALRFRHKPKEEWLIATEMAKRTHYCCEIRVSEGSRLRVLVCVYDTCGAMKQAWRSLGLSELGSGCLGAVNALTYESQRYDKSRGEWQREARVDPRYFAIMALTKRNLTLEIIFHESVHAAYCYAKRVWHRDIWAGARDLDEEKIAYPAGRIAGALIDCLNTKAGLQSWLKQ